ncbi:unnamed protein product [Diabrotica balteata]|uniref:DUF4806 domain-containing protein n=1 Tax=Diabrotica balteata TaxID=107213 RepID=A0A9N9SPM4_DIABA|nr:unnamed protein product [Diabrotica balteata]
MKDVQGNEVKRTARKLGVVCECKSLARFCNKIDEEVRREIFDTIWKLNWDNKKCYVRSVMKTWTIVRFLKDGSVEAVPTNWLSGNTCSWPHYEANKLGKALKNGDPPLATWEKLDISSFRNATYDDYSITRRKCQKAEETSDPNSSDNRPRRCRPPTKFATTSSSSDSENAMGHKNKTIQSNLPKMPEFALNKESGIIPHLYSLCFLGDSDSLQEEVYAKETMEDVESEYLKHILRKLSMFELIVTDLRAEVSNLFKISASTPPRELREQPTIINIWENFSLPLNSEEEFAKFEDFLKSSEKKFESDDSDRGSSNGIGEISDHSSNPNPKKWKRLQAKKKRNSSPEYVGQKGKLTQLNKCNLIPIAVGINAEFSENEINYTF